MHQASLQSFPQARQGSTAAQRRRPAPLHRLAANAVQRFRSAPSPPLVGAAVALPRPGTSELEIRNSRPAPTSTASAPGLSLAPRLHDDGLAQPRVDVAQSRERERESTAERLRDGESETTESLCLPSETTESLCLPSETTESLCLPSETTESGPTLSTGRRSPSRAARATRSTSPARPPPRTAPPRPTRSPAYGDQGTLPRPPLALVPWVRALTVTDSGRDPAGPGTPIGDRLGHSGGALPY